ncbi:MAG: glycoside hydrolase family 15 protein [Anaerolineae bacterium]
MADLYRHSIETMQAHQAPSGAYVASPSFPTYDYCWFRDGAFTAYAMDVAGQHLSSHRFHGWVTGILLRQTDRVERAIEKARQGEPLGDDYLHTRYKVEGEMGAEDWPNFQLDGLGTCLWALAEYVRRGANPLPAGWQTVVDLSARYLAALWSLPCYDLWEEHSHYLHPHTLGGRHPPSIGCRCQPPRRQHSLPPSLPGGSPHARHARAHRGRPASTRWRGLPLPG